MSQSGSQLLFIELTVDIVTAYLSHNAVPATELSSLLGNVHSALFKVTQGASEPEPIAPRPAVPPRKSVTNDYIICLEDGKRFKSLRRHLRTHFGLSPEEYRAKWGLPADYPMVAPNYARARSQLAKEMGLGQQRRRDRG